MHRPSGDPLTLSYLPIAQVNAVPTLYPGVCKIRIMSKTKNKQARMDSRDQSPCVRHSTLNHP